MELVSYYLSLNSGGHRRLQIALYVEGNIHPGSLQAARNTSVAWTLIINMH
jgi:hypothetical protein